jgi:hypothetical protein
MIEVYKSHNNDLVTIILTDASVARFKQLVQRGTNLWPDAHPEIKEVADILTTGQILQDYHGQDTSKS